MAPEPGLAAWVVAYLAVLGCHVVYNILTLIPVVCPAARVVGILLTIGVWGAWMPKLLAA